MLLPFFPVFLFLAGSVGTPLHRKNVGNVKVPIPPSGAKGEGQWLRMNEDVLPNHLEGVRLQRDGEVNKEFDHEAFLGRQKKDFDSFTEAEGQKKLREIFEVADQNGDFTLSLVELKTWIQSMIDDHFMHARDENIHKFKQMDSNNNGFIDWDEYVEHVHVPEGTNREVLLRVSEYHGAPGDTNRSRNHVEIDESSRTEEQRVAAQFFHHIQEGWDTADENDDGQLSADEFLNFQHPEHNRVTLQGLVSDMMRGMDQNGDNLLTIQEYVGMRIPQDQVNQEDREFFKSREKEFTEMVDRNGDGVADQDELEAHLDPQSEQHAYNEAMHLMAMADENQDRKLSLEEILENYDVFVGSPMVNVSRSFHDEF